MIYDYAFVKKPNMSCNFRYESVVGTGRMEIVPEEEKDKALTFLMRHYHPDTIKYNPKFMHMTQCMKLIVDSVTAKRAMTVLYAELLKTDMVVFLTPLYCHTKGNGECIQKDDMQEIYEALKTTDLLVFASPVYYWSWSGQLQSAVSRFYPNEVSWIL